MNPYDHHDGDESQLDRIERKLDRLEGSFLLTILLGAAFTAMIFVFFETVLPR
jgi:hypothetical protein